MHLFPTPWRVREANILRLRSYLPPFLQVPLPESLPSSCCQTNRLALPHFLERLVICSTLLEHLAKCSTTHAIFNKFGVPSNCIQQFLCLDGAAEVSSILCKRLKALSALYTIYNTVSHHPSSLPPLRLVDLIAACPAR